MKKRVWAIFIALLILSYGAFGQVNFEGVVNFDIKIAGDATATMLSYMMPDNYIYQVKGKKMKFRMEGGMMASYFGEFLIDGEKNEAYMLKADEATAYKIQTHSRNGKENTSKPQLRSSNETQTIAGYKCKKYEIISNNAEANQVVWVAPGLKVENIDVKFSGINGTENLLALGLDGFPLKIEANATHSGITFKMILTAKEVTKTSFKDSEFTLPKDYVIKNFDSSTMMGKF